MKTSNSTHASAFAKISKFHDVKRHESKRNDQSAYDAMCEMMQVDACLFAAPQGFAAWTTESQMRRVANDFGLIVTISALVSMEVNS